MLDSAVRAIEEAGGMQLLEGQTSAAKAELSPMHQDDPDLSLDQETASAWWDAGHAKEEDLDNDGH